VRQTPVAVEAESVHGAAGAERQRVTRLVNDASEGIGTRDSGQTILRAMAAMDQVGEVPLKEKELDIKVNISSHQVP